MTRPSPTVGLVLGTLIPPEQLVKMARHGERQGFEEIWFSEDYFYTAALSSATAALGATRDVRVGTGIISALVRHPAALAMEIATIARMFPGRFQPGIALGFPPWLHQMGLWPERPLTAVRECLEALRGLLAGEEVTFEGKSFFLDRIALNYPPISPVPLYLGGVNPRMLRLAGASADGSIVAILSGPKYVKWACEQFAAGAEEVGRTDQHRVVVFTFFSADKDRRQARDRVKRLLAWYFHECIQTPALFDPYGITDMLREMARGGPRGIEREMPDEWFEEFAVVGDPDECAERIRQLIEAGADSVALYPMPGSHSVEMVRLAGEEVLRRV